MKQVDNKNILVDLKLNIISYIKCNWTSTPIAN